MKKILQYLPFHFLIALILGILTQFFWSFWSFDFWVMGSIFFVVLTILLMSKNKQLNTFLAFFGCFFLGVSSVFINDDRNFETFYQHRLQDDSLVTLQISKTLKSTQFSDKYIAKIIQVDGRKTSGKVLLNSYKDSLQNPFKVDEILITKKEFKNVNSALNPHQFDYSAYLKKQGIYQQISLSKNQLKRLKKESLSLNGLADSFRKSIQKSLKKFSFQSDELAVINALILGQRQGVSKELLSEYANAGAIHILAVSGLHVGIILWILSFLLKFLDRSKHEKIVKLTLIVLFLWGFAFVAGLSASVVRAVTMFTFLAIGQAFQQRKVTEFSLITSMLFLLIFNPMFLFDVGFQLSYLAVFGIVWIQPKLANIWKPKTYFFKKGWQLFTVSIAAQLGILPLSLYYFHQFPGLFFLSNMIIIPFLGAILLGGILIIFLASFNVLPQFLANCYGYIILVMNRFVGWISHQEQFLLDEISMSFSMMIFWYGIIFFGVRFLMHKTPKKMKYFLSSLVILQAGFLVENIEKNNQNYWIVFHKSKTTIISKRAGSDQLVYHSLDSLKGSQENALKSYRIGENIQQKFTTKQPKIIKIDEQPILLVDSLGIYQFKGLKKPIIVLQFSPKVNLSRLIKMLKPIKIIADGSNYKSDVNRWKETAKKMKTPFHFTGEKGAFILKIKP